MSTVLPDRSFRLDGSRIGILLIHGLGGTPNELALVAKGLNRGGYTVACCQLAGHCGSEEDLLKTNWKSWADSVDEGFDALKSSCDHVYVGGLSMGAILAIELASRRHDDLAGLLLYAPTLTYDGWSIPWYSFILKFAMMTPLGKHYRFVEREPYGIKDKRLRARIVASMQSGNSAEAGILGTPAQSVQEFWRLVEVVKRRLNFIETPTLIVHARDDDVSSLKNAEIIARALRGPAEIAVLEDSYHLVTMDRQRDVVIDRSRQFIEAVEERRMRKRGSVSEPAAFTIG
jgi:carboxylesterase